MGGSKGIPCFALLAHAAIALPVQLSVTEPMSFLTSTLPIPTPIVLRESDLAVVWHFAAYQG